MTMVDWLLTEQLVEIFQEAVAKRPFLNAELVARDPLGEEGVLAGAGTAVRIEARDGSAFLVTPKRVARVVSDQAHDLVAFPDLIGYDWISPEMSEKVALKEELMATAKQLRNIPSINLVVLDTENKFISTGSAKELAETAGGKYHYIPKADDASISAVAKGAIADFGF